VQDCVFDTSRNVAYIRAVVELARTPEEELQERIRVVPSLLLAYRIRRARKDAGLSHDALGERMGGVSRQHLIKLEKQIHRPGAAMLTRIASATGRPVDWFLEAE
jgi:DNA-binding XRE family transcriptional regulator